VAEAVAQRLKRDRLGRAIEATAGIVPQSRRLSRRQVTKLVDDLRAEES
jgi:ribosome modulation factor